MRKDKDLPFNALMNLKPNIPGNKKSNCNSVWFFITLVEYYIFMFFLILEHMYGV